MPPPSPVVAALAGLVVLLAVALAVALVHVQRTRSARRQRGLIRGWGVPRVPLETLDPRFAAGPLGPKRENEIAFIPGARVPAGIADIETWILCLLARDARRIFEFGTGTGKTAYLLARNAPGALVTTLTIEPDHAVSLRRGDAPDAAHTARSEAFDRFYYEGASCAARIEQIVGDSLAFDESRWVESCDLVFVDGGHARSHVENDSRKALRMVRPGGWVVWHDYRGPRRTRGVYQALNALAKTLPLKHVAGTSLVVYRRPVPDGTLELTEGV